MLDKYSVLWSFRNRFEELKRSLETADATCDKSVEFHLVDAASDEPVIRELRVFCGSLVNRKIRICESSYRSSLSEAWNIGMMTTDARYVIFSSSDVVFTRSGWYGVLKASMESGSMYTIMGSHSVFAFDKKAIPKMGWFDESFVLGPHFDVDFMIRASEKGVSFENIGNDGYFTHVGIPGTYNERIKNPLENYLPMNDFTNERVFKEKWETTWVGWKAAFEAGQDVPHPPTNISQVRRLKPDIDPHPFYTKKYE
jgi:hypothetical protein